jgi:hypothetical protein
MHSEIGENKKPSLFLLGALQAGCALSRPYSAVETYGQNHSHGLETGENM